jgi:uncharacterized protein YjbI with pentapeptide repeats
MSESNSKSEKPKDLRFSQEQYDMLKLCSDKRDMTEWNKWRKNNPDEDILLERADLDNTYLEGAMLNSAEIRDPDTGEFKGFRGVAHLEYARLEGCDLKGARLGGAYLQGARLFRAHLENAILTRAHLENAHLKRAHLEHVNMRHAYLEGAELKYTNLEGTFFIDAHLENAGFEQAVVNNATDFWDCHVNRKTDLSGVGLDGIRIDPATKQLLQYNIRRKNWEDWYKEHSLLQWLVKPFWWISDYGMNTKRIIFSFFGLAFVFALLYSLFPNFVMVYGNVGDIRGFWHALYFSVVTMTTLGFGDIAANPNSWIGQTLLMLQVILGYVLLGALVTRFAVLFTAGGPAGKFADEKEEEDKE